MARLNEPSEPVESIETLKRKFMRQNRDIARANTTQSIRIRNLENETSRLLAENLGLREQIIGLQNELENGKSQRIAENTAMIKSRLEAKLEEIGALIIGLGHEPGPRKKSPQVGKITSSSPSRSPSQRNWKNMCTLSEAVGGQEGRLPAILENKAYPRRTLEPQELLEITSDSGVNTTDSPEIGPPPVSQFVDEDPVKIDLPTRLKRDDHDDASILDPVLSVNLEQRRKRRDSTGGAESKRVTKIEPIHGVREATGSLKAGAKRKLSVRDDDEHETLKSTDNSPDDFQFTRVNSEEKTKNRPVSQPERSGSKVARELAVARGAPREKQVTTAAPTSRKVLAPKSVNNSPRKGTSTHILDEIKIAKADILKANPVKERSRERRQDPVSIKPPSMDPPTRTDEVQPEPETPAGLDLFSPLSSQPSTARAESRDTPPPPDLGPGTEGQRPSRRSRPSVSYAEPNLRDKMRRPTKQLVDAVVPGTKLRASAVKIDEDDTSSSQAVKGEPEEDDAWKRMPIASSATVENSPLRGKVSVPESPEVLPSSIATHRKRRESLLHQDVTELPRSGSASAVAALLAENRKSKAEAKERALGKDMAAPKAYESSDIYDFKGSSPTPMEEALKRSTKEDKPASRFSRRNTTIRDIPPLSDSEASDMEAVKKKDISTSRRRQSALGLKGTSTSTEPSKAEDGDKALKRACSTIGMGDAGPRTDRVSARRRSMML